VITHHRLKVVEKREHTLFCADQFFGRKFSADHFFGRNDANIWHAPFAEIFWYQMILTRSSAQATIVVFAFSVDEIP